MKEMFDKEKEEAYHKGLVEGQNQGKKTLGKDDIANEVTKWKSFE